MLNVVNWCRLVAMRRNRLFVVEVTQALVAVDLACWVVFSPSFARQGALTYLPRTRQRPRCRRASCRASPNLRRERTTCRAGTFQCQAGSRREADQSRAGWPRKTWCRQAGDGDRNGGWWRLRSALYWSGQSRSETSDGNASERATPREARGVPTYSDSARRRMPASEAERVGRQ